MALSMATCNLSVSAAKATLSGGAPFAGSAGQPAALGCKNARSVSSSAEGSFFGSLSLPAAVPSGQRKLISTNKLTVRATVERQDSSGAVRQFALNAFQKGCAFKVIAGLHNFDASSVAAVVRAAEQGGATHVDIACDPSLVRLACSLTSLPVCVSAVEPELFLAAVQAGAHMVEIGNFDGFYKDGRTFSAQEVLDLTRRTRELLPGVALSVTVPHTLPLDQQVSLAEALEKCKADIIQTEGGTSAAPSSPGVLGLLEKAAPTLAAAHSISRAVSIPVMCASGLSDVTAPMAIAAGAAGVGVGSAINKLNDELAMIAAVRSIADAMGLQAARAAKSASQRAA